MFRRSRTAVAAAGLVAAAALVAGCSSSSTPTSDPVTSAAPSADVSASPASFIAQAAETTTASGTAKFSGEMSTSGAGMEGGQMNMTMTGATDFAAQSLEAQMTTAFLGQSMDMEMVVADGNTYMKMAMLGDKWIKAPAEDLGVTFTDPGRQLDQLQKIADLTEVGTETVEGVETTHYSGTMDLAEAIKESGLPEDQLQAMTKSLGDIDGQAEFDIWVDTEGRIVKVSQTMTLDMGAGGPVDVTSSFRYFDFGQPVDISAPPADQVIDAKDMAGLEGLVPQS